MNSKNTPDPENMAAKASLSPKDTLCVSFFIGDEAEIFTLKLQLKENTRTGCIDLSNAYFNGVVICGIDCLEVDLSNAETNNSRWYKADLREVNLKKIDLSGQNKARLRRY